MGLKVLHISSALTWRGGEQQIVNLVNALANKGITSIIMTPKGSIMSMLTFGPKVSIRTYTKGFSLNPLVSRAIKNICITEKVDIIHIHDSHAHTFTWLSYKWCGLKIPSVLSRRVDFPIKPSSSRKYNHPMIKRILCVSGFIGQIVKEVVRDKGKIKTVYSGIDIDKINKTLPISLHDIYNIPKEYQIIGNIAALADHKNHITLLKAVKSYKSKYPLSHVHFIIVGGDDGEGEALQAYIAEHQLDEWITMTGYVNNPIAHLKAMNIFLFTSKMEGLGTSVIDAMACGVPIISTQCGGLQELIHDGKTALAIPPFDEKIIADTIHRLLADHPTKADLIKGGKLLANQLSSQHTAIQTLDLYYESLKE